MPFPKHYIPSVYPNPSAGNLTVESDGGSLTLTSLDGKVILTQEINAGKTKLVLPQGLAQGMYMLKYKGSAAMQITRLLYQP